MRAWARMCTLTLTLTPTQTQTHMHTPLPRARSVMDLQKELEAMGGPAATNRGEMVHLVLTHCRKFGNAFNKLIDGGKGGGELILTVFGELACGMGWESGQERA
jgi:hypothetical protein